MNKKINLTSEQINEMLSKIPSSAIKNNKTTISDDEAKKLNELLSNKESVEAILKSEKAQELMKILKKDN